MDAARLLYGELELDASSALFAVDQLDEGFDILADQIVETQDGLGGLDNSKRCKRSTRPTGVWLSFWCYETRS